MGIIAPTSERRAPVIVIATANEAEGARHLRSLSSELTDIAAALAAAREAGICDVVTLPDATPEQVVAVFQNDAYRDRVAVLHFAGHAGPEGLLFETATGATAVADAGGLAAFLGCQRGLQLVVLNACATQPHVDALREAGVGAVIATSRSVEDAIAHEFAVLLYQGLGGGAGIKRAYDEAASGVRFKRGAAARGVTVDSMHASAEAVSVSRAIVSKHALSADGDRWPWDIYFRRGAEEVVAPWALPEAAGNPLFGLPTLPESNEPLDAPFRHLRPFAREHAELFFGRGRDIRELFDKVTGSESEPVTLLYGATGVGKSSLLDAGLLPRLTSLYEVHYAPRDRTLGLLGTLAHAVGAAELDLDGVAAAWRRSEETCGRPLFVVIDQIEEAYTSEDAGRTAVGAAERELDTFAAAIASLFGDKASRPRGRLVLGFRKEWLSEVKAALEAHRVARTEHRLDQLTRGGVLEAIAGPTRVSPRRMPMRLEVERDLDVQIADDLLANRASHVAPLLQILLAEMWAEARRGERVVRFDAALYDTVRARARQLDAFLSQQLDALRTWHAPTVDSGLALDYLRFHTTPKGTSDERTVVEEHESYPGANAPSPGLRAMCARLYLLVERGADDVDVPADDRRARLAHDTLAPLVRERFDRSEAPGPRARRILEGRVSDWSEGRDGIPLDEQDLALAEAGVAGMRVWTADERRLVEASRVSRDRARRRRSWVIRGAVAAVVAIAGFGVGSWVLYRQAQTRLAESQSRELAGRALATESSRRDLALLYAVASYEQTPTFEARRALLEQLVASRQLVRIFNEPNAQNFQFAPDGRSLVVNTADSILSRDIGSGRTVVGASDSPYGDVRLGRDGKTFSGILRRYSADGTPLRQAAGDTVYIGVWDVGSKREIGALLPTPSPDVRYLQWLVAPVHTGQATLAAVGDGDGIAIWDISARRVVRRLRGRAMGAEPLVFSRDGSVLIAADDHQRLTAWSVTTGEQLMPTSFRPVRAQLSVYDLTSDVFVMTDGGDTLTFWPLSPARELVRVAYPGVTAVAFSGNDSLLALGTRDGRVKLVPVPPSNQADGWRLGVASGRVLQPTNTPPDGLALSASGRRGALISRDLMHVWDLDVPALVESLTLPIAETDHVAALTADGRFAVSRSDSVFAVWDVTARKPIGGVVRPPGGGRDSWSITELGDVPTPSFHTDVGSSGRFLLDEPARGSEGPRTMYDTRVGGAPRRIDVPPQVALAMDPTGDRVAYGLMGTHAVVLMSLSDTARVDTLDAGQGTSPPDSSTAPNAAFSADGSVLAVRVTPRLVLVWDVATRRVRDSLVARSDEIGDRIHVSAGGRVVAAVARGAVLFWKAGASEPFARVPRPDGLRLTALSADGSLFAMENRDVTLLDVARGEALGTVPLEQSGVVVGMAFLDDGRLRVAREDGETSVVNTSPEWWANHACAIAASDAAARRWASDAPSGTRLPGRCERLRTTQR